MAELLERAGSEDVQTRVAALEELQARDATLDAEPLIRALSSESPSVRQVACKKLRESQSPAAVPKLIEVVEHDDTAAVRRSCAVALGELGKVEAVDPLLRVARGDESEDVRKFAVVALGALGRGEAVVALGEALVGPESESSLVVREAIVRALGRIADPRGVEPLVELYASQPRSPIIEALAAIGGDEVDVFLRGTLVDPDGGEGRLEIPRFLLAREDGAHDDFLLTQAKSATDPPLRALIYAAVRNGDLSDSRRRRFVELARTSGARDPDADVRRAAVELLESALRTPAPGK